jgi:hypothetical protein
MGEIIQSLKEFVWDIIGYLIPGFTFLIFFNFFVKPDIGVHNDFFFDWQIFDSYLIIVISYILGFMIYSLTIFKIKNQDYFISRLESIFSNWISKKEKNKLYFNKYIGSKHSKYWQEKFKESSTVKSAKEFLKNNGFVRVDEMELNEIRNILMSRNPEMDEKVYTFMFRSSVFDHLATILGLTCLGYVSQIIIRIFNNNVEFIKSDNTYLVLYVIFLILIPLLGNSKRIFRSISLRIPFSNLK